MSYLKFWTLIVSDSAKEAFFNAGYTEENLIDVVFNIADKTVSNLIHNLTQFEIDFPIAEGVEAPVATV